MTAAAPPPPHIYAAARALDSVLAEPISARALATPTFQFFQEIIGEVTATTGFGNGLYDGSELRCKTAEAKRTYVSKIAGLVGASLGTPVPPKPVADAVLVGGSSGSQALADFLVSLAHAAKGGRGSPHGTGQTAPSSRPTSARPTSARSSSGSDSAAPSARNSSSSSSSTRPKSGGGGVGGSSAWTCAHCGHAHDQSLPYCELCAKLRSAPRTSDGKPRAAEDTHVKLNKGEPYGTAGGNGRGGKSGGTTAKSGRGGGGGGGGRHPLEDQPLKPGKGANGYFWSATAADRDADLESEREYREAAHSHHGSRKPQRGDGGKPGRPGFKAAPKVEHWSDDDDDFIDQDLASRWRKSKAEQDERNEKAKQHEARRQAEQQAEEARQREAEAEEARAASRDATESTMEWEAFASLPEARTIRMRDVPWPKIDAKALGFEGSNAERKKAFRNASLRWHPDKFLQSFGGRLDEAELDAILQRVTEVSQAINAEFQRTA